MINLSRGNTERAAGGVDGYYHGRIDVGAIVCGYTRVLTASREMANDTHISWVVNE